MTQTVDYPRLGQRLQALLIDSLVLGLLFFSVLFLVRLLKLQNAEIESLLIILLWASFEPLCITLTGGSVGHHLIGLRVRRLTADKPLPLARAYLRFFFKAPLASVSLLSLLLTDKHRALHDFIARSLVVYRQPAFLPADPPDRDRYEYPSMARRLGVSGGYILAIIAGFVLASRVILDDKCRRLNICSTAEGLGLVIGSILLILLALAIIGTGWRGRLYGALKKPKTAEGRNHLTPENT